MKVALIGSGHIASIHGSIIKKRPNVEIVGIADKDLARAKSGSVQLNSCRYYKDAELMLTENSPDIVHVLTPPQFHSELSIMAMNRGCHVFVEKPLALTTNDAKKMIDAAYKNNVKLCVNHNMVYETAAHKAKAVSDTGILGRIVSVEACYQFDARRYPAILEEGAEYCHWTYALNGGPLQDLIPHPASLIFEYVSGIDDLKYIGKNRGVLPNGWLDEIKVLVSSKKVVGYISLSLSEKPDTIILNIKGTKGALQANLFSDILTIQKRSYLPRAVNRGLYGVRAAGQNLRWTVNNIYRLVTGRLDKTNGVAALISKFYESIENEDEPPIAYNQSLHVVELMEGIWPSPVIMKRDNIAVNSKNATNPKPSVLVTGASGFIGTHLVQKLLSQNETVRALVRPNSIHAGRLSHLEVEIVEGDLSDRNVLLDATKNIKTIYHACSPMSNDRAEYEEVAIKGTEFLIDAALKNNVKRFVQFSSLAVYELLKINDKIIREDSPYQKNPEAMGPYAWAKIEIEKRVFNAIEKQGLAATIVRPGIVIGPFCRVFFPHLGYNLQEQIFLVIGNSDYALPLTYVENTVDGIYKAGTVDNAIGQAYNLVDDGEITPGKYIEEFIQIADDSCKLVHLPFIIPYSATLAYEIASSFGLVKKGITSRAQLKWKQARVRFDNSKAKKDLGWEQNVSIADGIEKTFKWYINKYYNLN